MGRIIPTRTRDRLDFFAAHAPVWVEHAEALGISAEQAAAFAGLVDAALADYDAKIAADQAAMAATARLHGSVEAAHAAASSLIRIIKARAEASASPTDIYNLAQIPPPSPASPAAPPAQPRALAAALDAGSGALTLTWKATNPPNTQGTTYIVRRRLAPSPGQHPSPWEVIGITGAKAFLDATIPASPPPASIQYTVQGQRADISGPVSPILTVNFGALRTGRSEPSSLCAA